MDLFEIITTAVLWLGFVLVSSVMEATMFEQFGTYKKVKVDEHILLTIMRVYVYFLCFKSVVAACIFAIPTAMMFPFFHDGIYYQTRNWLNPSIYKKGWRDGSVTTDARFSIGWNERKYTFIIGLLIWLSITWALKK